MAPALAKTVVMPLHSMNNMGAPSTENTFTASSGHLPRFCMADHAQSCHHSMENEELAAPSTVGDARSVGSELAAALLDREHGSAIFAGQEET